MWVTRAFDKTGWETFCLPLFLILGRSPNITSWKKGILHIRLFIEYVDLPVVAVEIVISWSLEFMPLYLRLEEEVICKCNLSCFDPILRVRNNTIRLLQGILNSVLLQQFNTATGKSTNHCTLEKNAALTSFKMNWSIELKYLKIKKFINTT